MRVKCGTGEVYSRKLNFPSIGAGMWVNDMEHHVASVAIADLSATAELVT